MGYLRSRAPDLIFAVLVLVGAACLVAFGRGLTFFFDDWQVILAPHPLSLTNLLEAHNGQLFIVPKIVYGVLLNVFGMTSQLPFRLVNVAAATTCVVLLYGLVRQHVTPWLALVMVLPVLFLGAAWEALLLSLSMSFLLGLAAGLGMLLCLQADGRRSDLFAGLLLFGSLACGGIGLAFLAGAFVDVLIRKEPRRLWIPLVPLVLVAPWYLLGGDGSSTVSAGNLAGLPDYLFRAVTTAAQSLAGLTNNRVPDSARHVFNPIALLLITGGIVFRFTLDVRVPRQAFVVGAVLAAFWILGGLAMGEGRAPEASRYQYPAVVLMVALIACLLDGIRLPRRLPVLLLPLALVAVGLNLVTLAYGRGFLLDQTEITRAAIGQMEISARDLDGLTLSEGVTGTPYQQLITAGPYFRAADRFGSPAYDEAQIAASDAAARKAAAGVEMAAALFGGK